jgi:enoyl-CoA hydratase/carnithine racemase
LSIEQGIAVATLNRPEVRNAIDELTRAALGEILEQVAADDGIRALVLTGKGKAFCAGGDISAMQQRLREPAGTLGGKGWLRQRRPIAIRAGQVARLAQSILGRKLPGPVMQAGPRSAGIGVA